MFDFDELDLEMRDITSYEDTEYLEQNGGIGINALGGTTFQINMTDRDAISFPTDSYVKIKYQVVREDTGAVIPGCQIAMVNGGWNMFSRVSYKASGEKVEDIDHPGYVQLTTSLTEYSQDYEAGVGGALEFVYPDRGIDTFPIFVHNNTQVVDDVLLIGTAADTQILQPALFTNFDDDDDVELLADGEVISFISVAGDTATLKIDGTVGIDYTGIAAGVFIGYRWKGKFYENEFISTSRGIFTTSGTHMQFINDDAVGSTMIKQANEVESGFEKRLARTVNHEGVNAGSTLQEVELRLPLQRIMGFLRDNPKAQKGMTQRLDFILNTANDQLFGVVPTGGAKVVLTYLSWWIPILKVSPAVEQHMDSFLTSGRVKTYNWWDATHYQKQGLSSNKESWIINAQSFEPVKLYVFFQKMARLDSQTDNNMLMDNLGLRRLQIRVNSKRRYPDTEYEVDFKSGKTQDYLRLYSQYVKSCGHLVESGACKPNISYEEYRDKYSLFVFDLQFAEDVISKDTMYHVTVNWSLDASIPEKYAVNAVLMTRRAVQVKGISGRMSIV